MTKRAFDILLVVPLEEELLEVQRVFPSVENLSTDTGYRYTVDTGNPHISMLVVQQETMGKTSAYAAVHDAFEDFDFSLVACLGIAGSLTTDLNLCDVCYSEGIFDIYDNSKAFDTKDGELDIAFSTNYSKSYAPLVAALNFTRTLPELQDRYAEWQLAREDFATRLFPMEVVGRNSAPELIRAPKSKNCKIVCAAVSKSERYNTKIRNIDRKILAIETESGGVFDAAAKKSVHALTIRGISDHADHAKDQLEGSTGGKIRALAAGNAASFFRLQFDNPRFISAIDKLRTLRTGETQGTLPLTGDVKRDVTSLIADCAQKIDEKLRELSPEYKLLDKGYRLPVPRMRTVQYVSGFGSKFSSDPEEVREALDRHGAILLGLSKNYPDSSLAWIIASDLLTAVVGGKQMIPIVVDGDAVRPPRIGLSAAAHWNFDEAIECEGAQLVFIIDGAPLSSKTKIDFLVKEIKARPDCRYIIITRDETQIISESEFAATTKAEFYQLASVSFLEIAHFVEKNFDMTAAEAELIAFRLRETFSTFDLSAHPTYFAGISKELLATLLQANRRAELIQLAVDGFLTLVVAGDKANVTLSRTTRARFLRMIATEIRVEKRTMTREAIVSLAAGQATEFGYDIDPTAFVASFVDCGILHFSEDQVVFSLPFVESYLLAVELADEPDKAIRYFDLDDDAVDLATFDIYCEIKPSQAVIDKVMASVERGRDALVLEAGQKHILLTDAARPEMITKADRLKAIEDRFNKLSDDVRSGKGDVKRKQKLLDIADRVREAASDRSGMNEVEQEADHSEEFQRFAAGIRYWVTGAQMLGSAAEHLRAETKEKLSSLLIDKVGLLSHAWTEAYTRVDFSVLRKEFTSDDVLKSIQNGSDDKAELEETRRQVESMVDLLEFSLLAAPLRRLLSHLCERARLRVLAVSVEKASVDGEVQKLVHAMWLADIDGRRGQSALMDAVKGLPTSPFLRIVVATHLMTRVYWNQSDPIDRRRFLDAAEVALKPIVTLKKGEIIRYIDASAEKAEEEKA